MSHKKVLLSAIALVGCSTVSIDNTEYPTSWPKLTPSTQVGCEKLDGVYNFFGDSVPKRNLNKIRENIVSVLTGAFVSGDVELVRLRSSEEPSELIVRVEGAGLSIIDAQKMKYSHITPNLLVLKKLIKCDSGIYQFDLDYDSGSEGTTYKGKDTYMVFRDARGSIVVNLKYWGKSSASLGLFGYDYVRGNMWYRFQKMD